jgi:hypothetical protein
MAIPTRRRGKAAPSWHWLPMFAFLGCQAAKPSASAPEPAKPRAMAPSARPPATEAASAGSAPARRRPGVISDCANYSFTMRGPFKYENNMWAQGKATGPFEPCVVSRMVAGQMELGWTWNWPGYERLGFGYPEVIFGWKPWSNQSTTRALPLRIAELRSLTVRYAVRVAAEAKPHPRRSIARYRRAGERDHERQRDHVGTGLRRPREPAGLGEGIVILPVAERWTRRVNLNPSAYAWDPVAAAARRCSSCLRMR